MRCAVGKLLARPGKYDWIDSYSVSRERRAGWPRFSTHSLPTSFEQQNLIHWNAQSGFLEYVGTNRPRPPMIGRWPLSGVVPAGTMSTPIWSKYCGLVCSEVQTLPPHRFGAKTAPPVVMSAFASSSTALSVPGAAYGMS